MGNYFKDIKRPKWYVAVLFAIAFIFQCLAVINLCAQFGGGYYVIIPIQLVLGYLNVLMYLMIQKDIVRRDFAYIATVGAILGVAIGFVIFDGIYTSVPGLKGIIYGTLMQISLGAAIYTLIRMGVIIMSKMKLAKTATKQAEGE